jgi:phage terminase small subunit
MRQLKARMTVRQRRFIAEYVVDLNATKAAIRAGYAEKSAPHWAWQMLHWRPAIAEAIAAALKAREERTLINADRVVQQLARIAFADIRQLVRRDAGDHVVLKPLDEMSEDQQAAIAEIAWAEGAVRIKLADRRAALDSLARHLGLSGKLPNSTALRAPDQLPAREILRRKLAALAGDKE